MYLTILMLVICFLLAAAFIVIRAIKGANIWGLFAKTLASIALVVSGIIALIYHLIAFQNFFMLVVFGLFCGMMGDILLELKVIYKEHSDIYLNAGMIAFGVGHLLYLAAISQLAMSFAMEIIKPLLVSVAVAVVLTIAIIAVGKKFMKLNFGKHYYPTIAYTFLLTFASAYSLILAVTNTHLLLISVGIIFILLSDILLSEQYFGTKANSKLYHVLNHSLYYAGQILIVAFIFIFQYLAF